MNNIYCYATKETIDSLKNHSEKVLLIGGDFGYGNFGDILQLKGAINTVKHSDRYQPVCIFNTNAIRDIDFPNEILSYYGNHMFIFVSTFPLIFDHSNDPHLVPVKIINNVVCLYMYGGGFLNPYWGNGVLEIVEFFLQKNESLKYIISGQQITDPFHSNFAKHLNKYKPIIVGVRDQNSKDLLCSQGIEPNFSFDDATEELIKLNSKVKIQFGKGLFLHLNSSSYTMKSDQTKRKTLDEIALDLKLIKNTFGDLDSVHLLQAYVDAREEVVDTFETISSLETRFPFPFTDQILLPLICGDNFNQNKINLLCGEFAYSSSYHVAFWLSLSGIPCWLRPSNEFYRQKFDGLGMNQSLYQVLDRKNIINFDSQIEQRSIWLEKINHCLLAFDQIPNSELIFENDNAQNNPSVFFYKGYPTQAEQIKEKDLVIHAIQLEKESLGITHQEEMAKITSENTSLKKDVENQISIQEVAQQRILALTSLVTSHGSRIVELTKYIELVIKENEKLAEEVKENKLLYLKYFQEVERIYSSRSWKYTKPFRVLNRFLHHGYFDSDGKVKFKDLLILIKNYLLIR